MNYINCFQLGNLKPKSGIWMEMDKENKRTTSSLRLSRFSNTKWMIFYLLYLRHLVLHIIGFAASDWPYSEWKPIIDLGHRRCQG